MKKLLLSSVCVAVLAACGGEDKAATHQQTAKQPVEKQQKQAPAPQKLVSGIEMANIDNSVRPQDDLYRHVNGKWLNSFEIPADKSNYGSFTKLAEEARENVKTIIEEAAKSKAAKGTDAQKVGDLYQSYMDEALLEQIGTQPLVAEFEKINAIKDSADLSEFIAYAQIIAKGPFGTYVYVDSKDPNTYITQFGQGGLGLPGRDYYTKDDEKSIKIREQYVAHIANTLKLAGVSDADNKAKSIMALETQMANAHWTKEKNRNPIARYNKMSFAELQKLTPNMDWARWQQAAYLPKIDNVLVAQPDYLEAVSKLIKDAPMQQWKDYLTWHVASSAAPYLNTAMAQEKFSFYQGVLSGVKEQEPRWKRGVSLINGTLGEVVGKIYVERHFKPEAKTRMVELVENLRTAYGEGIKGLEWMSEDTKVQALDKLSKFTPKIGYPDKWKDYSELEIKADDLLGNMRRAAVVSVKQNREKLGQPVDRSEWFMTPQTVNAYYNPVMNEIVFPAAILQPPFFNLEADDAVNYGGIGAVIGHEMGHGFDDSGSRYDGDGKLRNWWTEEDLAEFKQRAGQLVEQYNGYTVLDGVQINGEFTLGENIGDLGGLTIAYKAYRLSLNGKEAPVIDGLTGDQRFFMGWAQVWARKYRDEELLKRISTDSHSPSEYRANGIVRNMPAFYQAFNVKEADKLYMPPEKRVKIW